MKNRYYHYLLATVSLLFLISCGGGSNRSLDADKIDKTQKEILTEDNYISLAKFHFSKESQKLLKDKGVDENNNKKFRSYPGAKGGELSSNSLLKISTVTPFNKYVESMIITSKNKEIRVEIKNRLYAVISLYENGNLLKTTKQTMHKFINFNLQDEGEES